MLEEIKELEIKFEDIKEEVNKGKLILLAKFEIEELLNVAVVKLSFLKLNPQADKKTLNSLKALVKQLKDYYDYANSVCELDDSHAI